MSDKPTALAIQVSQTPLDHMTNMICDGKSENTRRAYRLALDDFIQWFDQQKAKKKITHGFSRPIILSYIDNLLEKDLSPATINIRISALRALAKEFQYDRRLTKDQADAIMDIKNIPDRGSKTGVWLTKRQARKLLDTPDEKTLKGKQQLVILALFLGCALRREEAADLTCDMVKPLNSHWAIVNLKGKGNKTRTIPIPPWAIDIIHDWQNATDVREGKLLRAVSRYDRLTGPSSQADGGMSSQAIYLAIKKLVKQAGLPDLAPHSLRRTWAKTAYLQNAPLDQISLILGHSSIKTTEVYLGLNGIDLDNPVYVSFN